jgi:hypothetical protein
MTHHGTPRSQLMASTTYAIKTKRPRSPLSAFNYRVFIVPAILMLAGTFIWILGLILWAGDYTLILLGEILFAIGLFVAIILGFWVMTLIRMPQW